MNARIQVEHPVTEAISGIDLVEQQLLIADGQSLGLIQETIALTGHAIEGTDQRRGLEQRLPAVAGIVRRAAWPAGPGIRVDSHIAAGGTVPALYDSLIGKVIVTGRSREEAVARLVAALATLEIDGVETTAGLHRWVASDPRFAAGGVDTRFLDGYGAVDDLAHG
jgi:acetyl-CoA carboxylase biotin carboxylase subunit